MSDTRKWLKSQAASSCQVCKNPAVAAALKEWLDTRDEHGVSLLRFHKEYLVKELGYRFSYSTSRKHVMECLGGSLR